MSEKKYIKTSEFIKLFSKKAKISNSKAKEYFHKMKEVLFETIEQGTEVHLTGIMRINITHMKARKTFDVSKGKGTTILKARDRVCLKAGKNLRSLIK